jgi:HD-GYP domain-containing protein (c-di-GMP phosphodiesterase class II)
VGKIRTPDDILLKEHSLTNPETEEMRAHAIAGEDILKMASSLHRYTGIVRAHHEWYDGTGYPDGISGSEIPVHAQIIALADAFDAMTSTRPYRTGLTIQEAIDEILRFRGTQFSPALTDLFVEVVRDVNLLETEDWKGMAL